MTQADLDLLWKRVEEARLQWKSTCSHAQEAQEDRFSSGVPLADGSYVHLRALHAQRLAVENYHRALQDFNAALVADGGSSKPANSGGQQPLTRREREVLARIGAGKSSKEIAAELSMAFRTAICHRYRIQKKLQAHNTADLTRAALRMGLIEL